jgi:hypothetical protein
LAAAASASLDGQGSRTFTDGQVRAWGEKAAAALAAFDRIVPKAPDGPAPSTAPVYTGGSRTVGHTFQW